MLHWIWLDDSLEYTSQIIHRFMVSKEFAQEKQKRDFSFDTHSKWNFIFTQYFYNVSLERKFHMQSIEKKSFCLYIVGRKSKPVWRRFEPIRLFLCVTNKVVCRIKVLIIAITKLIVNGDEDSKDRDQRKEQRQPWSISTYMWDVSTVEGIMWLKTVGVEFIER